MVDRDIILEKVAIIQRCLGRISHVTHLEKDTLNDIDIQDIFVLNLQRAIQASVDIAAHVIAFEGYGLPDTLRAHFDLLAQNNIISKEISLKMKAMVSFRNIAVHEYQNINPDILKSILSTNLGDIEEFYKTILQKFE
ncbi:MAG: DUF86 domain-containing protein [Candidatus Marinimicrobia bacterium]|nr:DUF86 domain-containing protein [Candidatus Neomarinimicrobiota bacterium]